MQYIMRVDDDPTAIKPVARQASDTINVIPMFLCGVAASVIAIKCLGPVEPAETVINITLESPI